MKTIILGLVCLLSTAVWADPGDDFISYDPAWHLGVGLTLPTNNKTQNGATHTHVLVKGYLLTMGFPKEIGMQVLGLGVSYDSQHQTALVLSPMSYFIMHVAVGPDILYVGQDNVYYGMTLSYRF